MGKKTHIKEASPREFEELEQQVYEAFLARGWIIPQTEGDVSRAEAITAAQDHEEPPPELCDPYEVLTRSQGTGGRVTVLQPNNDETSEYLARAARAGKEIPSDVEKRMRNDREIAERKLDEQ
ncbi:MAG: hypothetical protein ACR2H4_03335 [Pyrinomonadaceae bacterium]